MVMLLAFWEKFKGVILTALATLAVLVGAYFVGGKAAKNAVLAEQASDRRKAQKKAQEAQREIDSMDDAAVRQHAYDRLRDGKR
jgi:hypothetical protein